MNNLELAKLINIAKIKISYTHVCENYKIIKELNKLK